MLLLIAALQDTAFPLSPSPSSGSPWVNISAIMPFAGMVNILSLGAAGPLPEAMPGLFIASCCWVVMILSLFLLLISRKETEDVQSYWPYRVFYMSWRFSCSILLLPVLSACMSIFNCGLESDASFVEAYGPAGFSFQCQSSEQVVLSIAVAVGLAAYIAVLLYFELTLVDRTPIVSSSKPLRRWTGRIDALLLLLRILLVVAYSNRHHLNTWILLIPCLLYGISCSVLPGYFLPYCLPWVNNLRSSFGGLFLWGTICTASALLLGNDQVRATSCYLLIYSQTKECVSHTHCCCFCRSLFHLLQTSAAYVFYFGTPMAMFACYAASGMRFGSFDIPSAFTRPYQIELTGRRMLWSYIRRTDGKLWELLEVHLRLNCYIGSSPPCRSSEKQAHNREAFKHRSW